MAGIIGCFARLTRKAAASVDCSGRPFFDAARVAIIMQRLSGAEWRQALAAHLPESVAWRVEDHMRREAKRIVLHELRNVVHNWQLFRQAGLIRVHSGAMGYAYAA